ncbi:MAG: YlmC/YmxH family sporulation protein [Oscillospiraceae bacterium]|nr:YlmC/YmxH family sporulation protein [Oscillospiraceae bacterium]
MNYKITDLRCREVINIRTGFRLGFVYDALFNIETGQLVSLVVPGPCRFFGIFGRRDDYIIPWECVKRVGDDVILIDTEHDNRDNRGDDFGKRKRRLW